ncbi:MAG TPA: transglycosylase SLT domain-containing protein [Anaeromyxobacteraceae bacterium]|nr:transglycosylase SLT domain-containing protein [Anaeromyxobacteraceae bacterium]
MRILTTVFLFALALGPMAARAAPTAGGAPARVRAFQTRAEPWTGDFEGMLERRTIRVLVPYSRTLYFNDRGTERGLTADIVREFERWLNKKHRKQLKNRPITVLMTPTTRDRLLTGVASGLGDIAVGNLTVTEERLRLVHFETDPDYPTVKEIVVTGPGAPGISVAEDLAGRTVHVRRASSYFESLAALNERLAAAGSPRMNVVAIPDALEDEDVLELVDVGLLDVIVVDDWKARMWAPLLPRIELHEQAVVRDGGAVGWAMRKDCPRLHAEIAEFMKRVVTKTLVASIVHRDARYRLRNPTEAAERHRFETLMVLFEKYGRMYRFDPLMLAAQGYQESRLDQNVRSRVGAIGVMQVMPATGKELRVGDIRLPEANIHAGTKYLDQLMTRYFSDADFDDTNRTLFAFASYNAGPANIARMRTLAAQRGFDPNQWFNHVEVVTARRIGLETTTYVRNVFKYYVAYKLMDETRQAAVRAREQIGESRAQ